MIFNTFAETQRRHSVTRNRTNILFTMEKIPCVIVDDEMHARKLLKKFILDAEVFDLVGEYSNATSALKGLTETQPKVIFLDIQMPGKTGIEMLERIEDPEEYIIVFTTAYDQYAIKAFENSAVDYLLKPFDEERFHVSVEKIKKAYTAMSRQSDENITRIHDLLRQFQMGQKESFYLERITCRVLNKLRIIFTKDIQYIKADGNYTQACTSDNSYLVDISISEIQLKLNPAMFVRIHRSLIVNTQYIVSVENHFNGEYKLEMQNKAILKVSRSYKDDFNEAMGVF